MKVKLLAPKEQKIIDPLEFKKICWPEMVFYKEQKKILYSIIDFQETFVPAGNGLGKDFISAFIALWFFCSRRPARVVTTSVKYDQLEAVLWGEIRQLIETSKVKLPIQNNHLKIRQVRNDGSLVGKSELVGQVVQQKEGLLGRHLPKLAGAIPTTLTIFDEASGIFDESYDSCDTWSHRKLIIGNCFPTKNFFFNGVSLGTSDDAGERNRKRNVIKIKATDSPNIRYAISEVKAGIRKPEKCLVQSKDNPYGPLTKQEFLKLSIKWAKKKDKTEPPLKTLIPGVVDYDTFIDRLKHWSPNMKSIGLWAEWYTGKEVRLIPIEHLERAKERFNTLNITNRKAKAIGCDPAEGGDSSSWSVVDEYGLIELVSIKTPDTTDVALKTIELMKKYNVPAKNVYFDRGGGGKQHADYLRRKGHRVKTVSFGGAVTPEKVRGMKTLLKRVEEDEQRYAYKNKRAELYGLIKFVLGDLYPNQFTIPETYYAKLFEQLEPIPLLHDEEGSLILPPKRPKNKDDKRLTLLDLIGYSPDETDSLALAIYGLLFSSTKARAGAIK